MLSPGRGMRRAAAAEMMRRPDAIGWKVSGDVDGHHLETSFENNGSRQVRVDGKSTNQSGLSRHLSIVWLTPNMDRLWTEGADGRRRFLDRIALSFHTGHGEATLSYEKAMRERNRLLKDQVRDAHWYAALEAQMAATGALIETARDDAVKRLVAAQEHAQSSFPKATLELVGPEGQPRLKEVETLADAFAASRPADLHAGRTLVGPHRADMVATYADKAVEAKNASTGEQKALLISLVLANARSLQSQNRAPVVLLDEVAAHLDTARRAALFDEISTLGIQAWMTGTGPELFEDVAQETMKVSVHDDGTGSEVTPI